MSSAPRVRILTAGLVGMGLIVHLGLHFVEPQLTIIWSFGHLGTSPLRIALAAGIVVAVPGLVMVASRSPWWHLPARQSSATMLVLLVALGGALGTISWFWPVFEPSLDKRFFLHTVGGTQWIARWQLGSWLFHALLELAGLVRELPKDGHAPTPVVVGLNVLFGVLALTALAGASQILGTTRGESTIITLLAWTTFGVLELSAGYSDIYPIPLALLSLYLWMALRAVRRDGAVVWPLVIAAIGPFFYEGLALLAPSALAVASVAARRVDGMRAVTIGLACAFVAAGLATVPVYHAPFAWQSFVADVVRQNATEFGYSPTSNLVPWWFFASATHAREVVHTVLLIDAVGVLTVLVVGPVFWRDLLREPELLIVATVVAPYLAFVGVMDPVYGAFADWDLFSYGAAATSLLGGALLVRLRRHLATAGLLLLGLAVAANGVHLLARFHRLQIDFQLHLKESPPHTPAGQGQELHGAPASEIVAPSPIAHLSRHCRSEPVPAAAATSSAATPRLMPRAARGREARPCARRRA